MTRLRTLILGVALAAGAILLGPASPASADTDLPPYTDCAQALNNGSAGTGRMACFDRVTAYGPIFQVFSNWGLYYAAPFSINPRSNVYNNHRWTGGEYVTQSGPAQGWSRASDAWRSFHTRNVGCQGTCQFHAWSTDPGVLAWFHGAAADPTLNVVWIDR